MISKKLDDVPDRSLRSPHRRFSMTRGGRRRGVRRRHDPGGLMESTTHAHRRDRRRPGRPRRRGAPDRPRPRADRVRGRRRRSARACASGATCACSRPWEFNVDPAAAELLDAAGLDGARARRLPDRRRDRRALPRAARGAAADRRRACTLGARVVGGRAARARQAQGRRPRGGAVRAGGRAGRRRAARAGARGDRRVRDLDAARTRWAPAGCRRSASARSQRSDRLRHPRRARPRARALRGQARAGRGQRPLGVQRDPGPRGAARLRARDRDRLGDPRRRAGPQVRRRRR